MDQVLIEISLQITADKRETKDFPKLPSPISFIRKPLDEMAINIVVDPKIWTVG